MPREKFNKYRLFKPDGSFELPEVDVPVNPYVLGLWLGDGSRDKASIITNHEPTVREFLQSYAVELDLYLTWNGGISYNIVGNPRVADRRLECRKLF